MNNTNCPNCDKPECARKQAIAEWQAEPIGTPTAVAAGKLAHAAMVACDTNTVNWRARALTEAARADAAEAMVVVAESVLIGMALYAEKSHARPYDTTASAWQMGVNEATVGIGTDLLRLIRPYTEVASIAFAAEMRRRQS